MKVTSFTPKQNRKNWWVQPLDMYNKSSLASFIKAKDTDKSNLGRYKPGSAGHTWLFSEYLRQNLIISAQKKYGKVTQLSSKGLYSFHGVWGVFVQPQFRTRYSGHTLSRLAEIRHNKTKQSRFPTTRRESPKTRTTWNAIQVCLA
jgi:hypothetical protein